ncbi:beta strand repeat-containing protein [Gimesia aquarii]|uniref:Right handed beta helix domain-containing protein n=1 Tax=Gimesia aquarii TaxID=2527964 RepID=A0A517WT93_9PLAN|nr:right-handed parallel beta-helix repeat-containing protein [Gimesia aquarii]QDU08482.1 hypothetical protein V202x_18510 [Gimesia aquarii]
MKQYCLAVIIILGGNSLLFAQTIDQIPEFDNENYSGDVSELFGDSAWFGRYHPHFGYSYEAGDTIGRVGGLSSFEGFLPLFEGYNSDWLAFLDARLLLDDENHNLGSNIGIGARQYLPEYQRTIGGYIYYDTRDTGYANFGQVSGGIETLGDFWDARLNWYIPTGTRRKLLRTTHDPTGTYTFIGHHLFGGTFTRFYQAAMTGVDMEAGRKIYSGPNTDVRAFAGWYHFQANGTPQAWGWKSRIEGRISDVVALNLSIQNDRVFDTTVNFAVSFQWPSITGLRNGPRSNLPARDRLGEAPERLRNIVVTNQEIQDPNGGLLIDPSTGLPYFFMHVETGGSGDGTFEDPFGTLAAAFADTRTQQGNVVVYDHRNAAEAGNFTLATNTQVLSSGPAQFITTQVGQVQLPDSNTGLTPQITGSFTLNNRSVLSGFGITTTGAGSSIISNGVGNLMVSNNTINHTGAGTAISLSNLTGPATFNQTPLTKSGGLGVLISGGNGDVTFTNSSNTNTNGDGIDIQNAGGTIQFGQVTTTNGTTSVNVNNGTANITIDNLSSTNAGADSVLINNLTGSFTLNGGTLTNSGATGVTATNSQNITIQNTTIDTPTTEGIFAQNVTNFNFSSNTIDDASIDGIAVLNGSGNGTISGNTIRSILTAFDDAIDVEIGGDATVEIDNNIITSVLALAGTGIEVSTTAGNVTTRIRGNQITSILNAFGDGINYTGNSTGAMTTTITGNTIQNTAGVFGDGISVIYNAGSATTTISQNTIDSDDLVNLFGTGIYLGLNTTGTTDTTINQNTISDDVLAALFDDGISLDIDRGTDHDVFVTNNLIAQTGGLFNDSIEVLLDSGTVSAARIQVNSNILFGAGGGGTGLDVFVGSPHLLCVEATGNTTNTSLDFFAAVGGTINVEDLPNLSTNNNGATVNTAGGGTIQNIADCFP